MLCCMDLVRYLVGGYMIYLLEGFVVGFDVIGMMNLVVV